MQGGNPGGMYKGGRGGGTGGPGHFKQNPYDKQFHMMMQQYQSTGGIMP